MPVNSPASWGCNTLLFKNPFIPFPRSYCIYPLLSTPQCALAFGAPPYMAIPFFSAAPRAVLCICPPIPFMNATPRECDTHTCNALPLLLIFPLCASIDQSLHAAAALQIMGAGRQAAACPVRRVSSPAGHRRVMACSRPPPQGLPPTCAGPSCRQASSLGAQPAGVGRQGGRASGRVAPHGSCGSGSRHTHKLCAAVCSLPPRPHTAASHDSDGFLGWLRRRQTAALRRLG